MPQKLASVVQEKLDNFNASQRSANEEKALDKIKIQINESDRPTVVIPMGAQSAGKSWLAEQLCEGEDVEVCSADSHMIDDTTGLYNFKPHRLHEVHSRCRDDFNAAVSAGKRIIFVDNMNIRRQFHEPYLAKDYQILIVNLEVPDGVSTSHAADIMCRRNRHSVPEAVIKQAILQSASNWKEMKKFYADKDNIFTFDMPIHIPQDALAEAVARESASREATLTVTTECTSRVFTLHAEAHYDKLVKLTSADLDAAAKAIVGSIPTLKTPDYPGLTCEFQCEDVTKCLYHLRGGVEVTLGGLYTHTNAWGDSILFWAVNAIRQLGNTDLESGLYFENVMAGRSDLHITVGVPVNGTRPPFDASREIAKASITCNTEIPGAVNPCQLGELWDNGGVIDTSNISTLLRCPNRKGGYDLYQML